MSFRHSHKDEGQGIGLYTHEQVKNNTPFQFFVQIVVGAVVFFSGLLLLVDIFDHRSRETLQSGSPEPHSAAFALAAAVIVIGVFMAHAGVIFWTRRLRMRLKNHHQRHVS